jgi:hypothetical protein
MNAVMQVTGGMVVAGPWLRKPCSVSQVVEWTNTDM